MLKPFRIKDLLHDEEDLYSASPTDQTPNDLRDAVVQITATQYDNTVTNNPAARLSYVDEDDGEHITVSPIYPQAV